MTLPVELDVGDLLVPRSDAARLDHLRSEGLDDRTGLDWVLERADELVHHDPMAAEELCRLSELAAGPERLVGVLGRASYLRAQIVTERGDLEAGLGLVERARALWLRAGQPTDALRTDLGRMSILDDLGRHAEALAVGSALLAALDEISTGAAGGNPLPDRLADAELVARIRASAWENIGAAYGFTGQHERALTAYAEAERGFRDLGLLGDTARPLGNRGIELLALGRPREAMSDLRAAVDLLDAADDRLYAALCQGFLAEAHHQLGELTEALALLEPARVTLDELGARAEADRLQLAIAQTYLAVGLQAEARHAAGLAAERLALAGMTHDAAVAHFVFAQAALGEQDGTAAQQALGRATALFDQVGDRQYRARSRLAQAEVSRLHDDRAQAAALAGEAADELAAGGWLVPLTWARLLQADLARDVLALDHRLGQAGELVAELRLPALTYQYTLRRARQARTDGRIDDAERLLAEVLAHLEQTSSTLPDHALRTAFRSHRTAAHDELVDLLLQRAAPGDTERARDVSNSAKAQTLGDLLATSVGREWHVAGAGTELSRCRADLNAAYLALQDATDAERRGRLRREVDRLEQQVSTLRVQHVTAHPLAAASSPVAAQPDDSPAPTVLEFHVLGDDVVVFATVAGRLTVRRLHDVVPDLHNGLDRLSDQWSRFQLGSAFRGRHSGLLVRTADEILHRLYATLLHPVEDLLASAGDTLHLVPHGVVGQLPLQALYDGQQHLLERFTITVSPTRPVARSGPAAGSILTRPLVVGVADAAAPAVATEARAVAARLPRATLLVGEQASRAVVWAALPGVTLLHLACHGLYRPGNPLFSRLRLADRWVTSAEILGLDLNGALVVLSACESGQHGRAAEPVGLGWAFLAAGASGVVSSQWVVHDATATTVMERLYEHLVDGLDPAQALRRAQRATALAHPHPFYWAPFTYVSAPGPSPRSTA